MEATSIFEKRILPLFEATRADWLETARLVAEELGRDGREVTVDDVRAIVPPPDEVDPRVMGSIFKSKRWECVGYRRSKRPECHNRPVGIFKLKAAA